MAIVEERNSPQAPPLVPEPQIGAPLPQFNAPPSNIFESLAKYLTDPLERERYRRALGDVPVLDPILKFGSDVAEQVFPPFFAQRQQFGLEDPTIPPILPGIGLAVGAGKNIGKAKGAWEPVERFGNWVLRNADTGEIDKGLVFTGKNAAEKAAEVVARRASSVSEATTQTIFSESDRLRAASQVEARRAADAARSRDFATAEFEASKAKGSGMRASAARRQETGNLTAKEQAAALKKAQGFNTGDSVQVTLADGSIVDGIATGNNPFGRVGVIVNGSRVTVPRVNVSKRSIPSSPDQIARATFGGDFVTPTAARVAPKVGQEVPQTPGFLQTAEQKIGGRPPVAQEASGILGEISNDELLRLQRSAPEQVRPFVDEELARRGRALFQQPGELNITAALQQIPRPMSTAVRRLLRSEPGLTTEQLLVPQTGFEAVVDNALRTVRADITPENRLKIMGALLNQEKTANIRNPLVNAAKRKTQIDALQQAIPTPPAGGPATVGEAVLAITPPRPPRRPPTTASPEGGGMNVLGELFNFSKTARTILDASQLFRQSLVTLASNALSTSPQRRLVAARGFKDSLRGLSKKNATEVWAQAQADPLFQIWKNTGGMEQGIGASAANRSEYFQSKLVDKIPVYRALVGAAESGFGLTINSQRFYTFKEGVEARARSGRPMSAKEMAAFNRFLNASTGTGTWKALESDSKILNGLFWAPKFVASRIQAPIEPFRALKEGYPELAKREAQDLIKTFGAGFAVLQLANAAGFKVGLDPTSSDFGKIVVGNTSFDIWGGFQQPAVLVARLYEELGQKATTKPFDENAIDILSRFAETKIHPTLGTAVNLVRGEDFVGQPFGPKGGEGLGETILSVGQNTVVPLNVETIWEAIKDSVDSGAGAGLAIAAGIASTLGVGVSTYDRPDLGVTQERNRLAEVLPKEPTFSDLSLVRQTQYQHLVKEAVDVRLTSLLQSPQYQSASDAKKQEILDSNKRAVEREVKVDFALNVAMSGSPDELVPAINGALDAAGTNYLKGQTLEEIRKMGKLTPEVIRSVDARRVEGGLTVDEYLRGSQEVKKWLAAPEFVVGSKAEWDAAALAASRLRTLVADAKKRGLTNPMADEDIANFYLYSLGGNRTTTQPGWLATLYEKDGSKRDGVVSQERKDIQKSPLWDRFRSSAQQAERVLP